MKTSRQSTRFVLKTLCTALLGAYAAQTAANPSGGVVGAGSATLQQQGKTLLVSNTSGTVINWTSFSIGRDEITRFVQHSSGSAVLNRVTGQDPSQILGQLQSNGRVFLINPNGIVFGQGAQIDTAGLVASTLNLSDADFAAGKLRFEGAQAGSIENAARISTPSGGFVYLLAPTVLNSGVIVSPQGEILLAAGHSVELVDGVDTSLRARLDAPAGSVLNLGQLIAEQGRVGIFAAALQQQGLVSANRAELGAGGSIVFKAGALTLAAGSISEARGGRVLADAGSGDLQLLGRVDVSDAQGRGGQAQLLGGRVGLFGAARLDASGRDGGGTVLVGGDFQGKNAAVRNARQTVLAMDARIDASATGRGDGGRVIVWSDGATQSQGQISARGGASGGDGGFVEVSGKQTLDFSSTVDTRAARGRLGSLLLDPTDLDIIDCGAGCGFGSPVIGFGDLPSAGGSNILGSTLSYANTNVSLQATNSINFYDPVSIASAGKSLTAEAGNAINVYNTIYAPAGVTLKAPSVYISSNVNAGSSVRLLADGLTISGGAGALVAAPEVVVTPYSAGFGLAVGGAGSGSMMTISTGSLGGIDANASLILKGENVQLNSTLNRAGTTTLVASSGFQSTVSTMSIGGRYLVYAADPASSNRNGAGSYNKHYDVAYSEGGTPSYASSGNWFFYSVAPTLQVQPTGGSISYGAVLPSGYNLGAAGLIDGDLISTAGVGGTALFTAAGATLSGSGHLAVGSYSVDYTGGLASSLGYRLASSAGSVTVAPATLSLAGGSVSKVYDGHTGVVLSGASLAGLFSGDRVSVAGSFSFADKNVGTGKAVSGSASLSGADAGNYVLTGGGGLTGSITPATLSLSGVNLAGKVYDGTTQAVIGGYGALQGMVAGDTVQVVGGTATFADKNVGNAKAASYAGIGLAGADAGNYQLHNAAGTTTGAITPAALSLSGVSLADKVYDGTTQTVITGYGGLDGLLAGDSVHVVGGTAAFADKNVGNGKAASYAGVGLAGADARNYVLQGAAGSALGSVTPATLSLAGVTVANKIYDGTTRAAISGYGPLLGLVAGDVVQASGGTAAFTDKNVGSGKAVGLGGLALAGKDAGNYVLSGALPTAQADIGRAATTTWVGGAEGLWSDTSNWAGGVIPDLGNVAQVSIPGGTRVLFDASAGSVSLDGLDALGLLRMSGGTLAVRGGLSSAQWQQSGGALRAGSMTVSQAFSQSGGSIDVSSGLLAITQVAGALQLGDIQARNLTLSSAGVIGQTGSLHVGQQTLLSGGSIILDSAGNELGTVTASAGGDLTLRAAGDLALAQVRAGGLATLSAGGALRGQGDGLHLQAGAASLQARSVVLTSTVDQLSLRSAGDAALLNQRDLVLGPVSAGGALSISSQGSLMQSGELRTAGGSISLLASGGDLRMAADASTRSQGGAIRYAARGHISLGLIDAGAGTVTLDASRGNILPVAGAPVMRAGAVEARAAGVIQLRAEVPAEQLRLSSTAGVAVAFDAAGRALPGASIAGINHAQGITAMVGGLNEVAELQAMGASTRACPTGAAVAGGSPRPQQLGASSATPALAGSC